MQLSIARLRLAPAACGLLAVCAAVTPLLHGWSSTKVVADASGRLSYPADSDGNRIPDFSHAGYQGGGVPLPDVPVVMTIAPVPGDNTSRLQAALNEVGELPLQASGYRGTLLLSAGVYEITGTLRLDRSGIVLAGVGDRDDPSANTLLRRTGTSTANVITAGGGSDDSWRSEVPGSRSQITTPRVQVGARSFEVNAPVFNHLSPSYVYKYDRSGMTTHLGIKDLQIEIVTAGPTSEMHAQNAIVLLKTENSWVRDCTV